MSDNSSNKTFEEEMTRAEQIPLTVHSKAMLKTQPSPPKRSLSVKHNFGGASPKWIYGDDDKR